MCLLEGIGALLSLLPIVVFLYLVTFGFSHSMSLWKKNVEMGLSHVGDREQTLVWKKKISNLEPPSLSQTFHGIKIPACNLRGKIKL